MAALCDLPEDSDSLLDIQRMIKCGWNLFKQTFLQETGHAVFGKIYNKFFAVDQLYIIAE